MDELRVRNWDKWQSYRRDRGQPPWIKVHRALMRDMNWVSLSDAERGQLVAIWMLAADKGGVIPSDPFVIQKLCFMESAPNLKSLMDKGFIEHDANMTPTWRHDDVTMTPGRRQDDANMTPQRRVEESREEERRSEPVAGAPEEEVEPDAVASVVCAWNTMASAHGLPTVRAVPGNRRRHVTQRLKGTDWRRDYESAIATIPQSRFLLGKVPPRNGSPPWKANFDWFVRPDSVTKILEGQYEDSKQQREGEYVGCHDDLFDD